MDQKSEELLSCSTPGDTTHRLIERKLLVVMVGLPVCGKSYAAWKLCRYLNWMGYVSKVFFSMFFSVFFSMFFSLLVGLPVCGKSYAAWKLCRYLNWMGYVSKVFFFCVFFSVFFFLCFFLCFFCVFFSSGWFACLW